MKNHLEYTGIKDSKGIEVGLNLLTSEVDNLLDAATLAVTTNNKVALQQQQGTAEYSNLIGQKVLSTSLEPQLGKQV